MDLLILCTILVRRPKHSNVVAQLDRSIWEIPSSALMNMSPMTCHEVGLDN